MAMAMAKAKATAICLPIINWLPRGHTVLKTVRVAIRRRIFLGSINPIVYVGSAIRGGSNASH